VPAPEYHASRDRSPPRRPPFPRERHCAHGRQIDSCQSGAPGRLGADRRIGGGARRRLVFAGRDRGPRQLALPRLRAGFLSSRAARAAKSCSKTGGATHERAMGLMPLRVACQSSNSSRTASTQVAQDCRISHIVATPQEFGTSPPAILRGFRRPRIRCRTRHATLERPWSRARPARPTPSAQPLRIRASSSRRAAPDSRLSRKQGVMPASGRFVMPSVREALEYARVSAASPVSPGGGSTGCAVLQRRAARQLWPAPAIGRSASRVSWCRRSVPVSQATHQHAAFGGSIATLDSVRIPHNGVRSQHARPSFVGRQLFRPSSAAAT